MAKFFEDERFQFVMDYVIANIQTVRSDYTFDFILILNNYFFQHNKNLDV
jgi:hypothetical protein